ncbi:MAG: hypothetical protein MRY78_04335 [Saprospiraceae bacterium]|nr:hypothetical protein [Saprospiraceae bacterium]
MGCTGCSVNTSNGKPKGCKSNGGCSSGGCNKMNTFDWLSVMEVEDPQPFDIVEVSFKNGARKGFYKNPDGLDIITGDDVVVETGTGYDIGRISLSGDLVRLQMRKKNVSEDTVLHTILRRANERDMERLSEARSMEKTTMIRSRVIARTLDLEMKIGDVEYQGDKRKATFYYTADGRVDFRELIRHYAKEFRVKIEMRQIGARQESARIGGLGSCGRELCCSTWLTDFKSVSTAAARYQNLAINQAKLSGQCGRLKCCLNYELDTYLDALDQFPKDADKLHTLVGTAALMKTDIFKGIMYYIYIDGTSKGKSYPLPVARVKAIRKMNKANEKPSDLIEINMIADGMPAPKTDFEDDVTGFIELPPEEKRKKKKRRKNKRRGGGSGSGNTNQKTSNNRPSGKSNNTSKGNNNQPNKPKVENKKQGDQKGPQKKQEDNSKRDNSKNRKNRRWNKNRKPKKP